MRYKYIYLNIIFLITLFTSCKVDESIPDVSDIAVKFELERFEHSLFKIDTNNFQQDFKLLNRSYRSFGEIYFRNVMPHYLNPSSSINNQIKKYISDSTTISINAIVQNKFGDFKDLKQEFTNAFTYYKYYFPSASIPFIYTYVSSFSYQAFLFNVNDNTDGLAIGLDMFLNKEIPYKEYFPKEPQFSNYNIRSFNEDHIVSKAMNLLLEDKINANYGKNMLDQIIQHGKIIYILDHILPYQSDTIIINYSKKQLDWCEDNEYEIWTHFKTERLLYETNSKKIAKYISPAPFSPNMDEQTPGRVAIYLGWKIVENYMDKYPNTSFDDLLLQKTPNEILKRSKYKPKRKY